MALIKVQEFQSPEPRERVLLARKEHLLVLMVGTRRTYAFDAIGRLLYAAEDGRLSRRGLDNSLLRVDETPHRLPPPQAMAYVQGVYRDVERLARDAPPSVREGLAPILDEGLERIRRDAPRFAEIYGKIPVLPPDQYNAIYLQPAIGCAYGRCTFCSLFQGIPFRARSADEFGRHLRDVQNLLGSDAERRTSIFLGDAGALCIPAVDLVVMMHLARAVFPKREFHAFADATLHITKSVEDLRELKDHGLSRVTVGLETGHAKLYEKLRKPGTVEGAARSLRLLKEAELNIGVTLLVGVGGREYFDRHLKDTVEMLQSLDLGEGDYVYLSPLVLIPQSDYLAWSEVWPGRILTKEETAAQLSAFRQLLSTFLQPGGARIATYDISRFVY
ncbi:MAG: radical SAM protein [Planctomycetes bacterium]|nr:radical SAM protein [Planctomycetota bacterium]